MTRPPRRSVDGEYLKDLLLVLVQKELKIRYKSRWLGYLWFFAQPPGLRPHYYYVAFGIFMRVQIPDYPLFLICGLSPWQWLENSLRASPLVFLGTSLLKRVQFPRNVLVAGVVLNDGIHFVLSVPVISGFLLAYRLAPSWSWLIEIPLLALAQFTPVYGVALAIASLNLFFRDLERLTALLVTFLLLLTPVVYADSMIPAGYRALLDLNPVAPLIPSWRNQSQSNGSSPWPALRSAN